MNTNPIERRRQTLFVPLPLVTSPAPSGYDLSGRPVRAPQACGGLPRLFLHVDPCLLAKATYDGCTRFGRLMPRLPDGTLLTVTVGTTVLHDGPAFATEAEFYKSMAPVFDVAPWERSVGVQDALMRIATECGSSGVLAAVVVASDFPRVKYKDESTHRLQKAANALFRNRLVKEVAILGSDRVDRDWIGMTIGRNPSKKLRVCHAESADLAGIAEGLRE